MSFIKNELKPLNKITLTPLGLTGAAPATHADIQMKVSGSGMITLLLLNEEIYEIKKTVKSLKESALLEFYQRNN